MHRHHAGVTGAARSCRFIPEASSRLAALSRQLLSDWQRSGPLTNLGLLTMLRCAAACYTASLFSAVCTSSTAAPPLLRCASLAMGPGTAVLERIAARAWTVPAAAAETLQMAVAMMGQLTKLSEALNQEDALVQQVPPAQLLAFLWVQPACCTAQC